MTLQDQKPLLPALWNRIKRFFVICSADDSACSPAKLQWRIGYLERCLLKNDAIEATRIQLEHNWEDVSR